MANRIERDTGRYREIVKGQSSQRVEEVYLPQRTAGKKGKDLVSIPSRASTSPFSFRPGRDGGSGPREKASGRHHRAGPAGRRQRLGRRRPSRGRTSMESRAGVGRAGRDVGVRRWSYAHRARGKDYLFSQKDRYTSIRQVAPKACVTLSGPTNTPSNARSRRAPTTRLTHALCLSGKTNSTARGKTVLSPGQRRHHLHDGCVRLDGAGAERHRAHGDFLDWRRGWRSQYHHVATRYIVHDVERDKK